MALKPIGTKGLLTINGIDLVKFVPELEAIQIATDNAIGNGDATTLQSAKDDATTKYGGLSSRVTEVETKNTAQDTAITNARTGAVADAKVYADQQFTLDRNRLTGLEEPRRDIALSEPGTTTDTRTALGVRIPFRAPFGTSKFRVHIRNRNPQTGQAYTGAVSFTALGIGQAQVSGGTIFPGTASGTGITTLRGSFSTPTDGSEFVTDWFTNYSLTGGTWYLLTYGYNNPSAFPIYTGKVVAWTTTSPTVVLNSNPPNQVKEVVAPFDVWIEAVAVGGASREVIYAGEVPTGTVDPGAGLPTSSRTTISALGDSLTDGGANGITWPEADTWPTKLDTYLTTATVTNLGFSSATVDELMLRIGAKKPAFTVTGGTIPSTGFATLTTPENLGVDNGRAFSINGKLDGVQGILQRLAGGELRFNVYGTPAKTVTGPVTFIPEFDGHHGDTVIIWVGINDITFGVKGIDATIADHVVGGIQQIIQWLTPQIKQFMLLGVTTRTTETTGSTNHTTATEINSRLQSLYPGKFKSVQKYLREQAMTDLGITPTQDDLDKIAAGTLPPSVLEAGDIGHISKATATVVATHLVGPWLKAKGYVSG